MRRRVILGFLVAPALVPAGVIALMAAQGTRLDGDALMVPAIYAAFTYGAAAILGAPLFALFSRLRWSRWWQYLLGGAAIGLAIVLPFAVMTPEDVTIAPVGLVTALGAASALAFWLLAIRESRAGSAR
jgi:hypothetical protein